MRNLLDMKALRFILPALLAAALSSSCSVKEDRSPCPCLLDIRLGDSGSHADRLAISAWNGSGRIFLDRIDIEQYPESYQKKVSKGFLNVCAYGGVRNMSLKGSVLTIPEGSPCDPVWAYCGPEIDATGETAEDLVTLHKQHAVVHVRLDSLAMQAGGTALRATGGVNGFDITTFTPVRGSFHCFATLDEDFHYTFCVPRQLDDSLELEVYLGGVLSRTVKIGDLIANAGYSWTKEDLDDIYISLGVLTSCTVTISVNGWDTEAFTFKY